MNASFISLPLHSMDESVRVNVSEISRYSMRDRYRPGDGSCVILKDGTRIHTSSTCEQIDEAIQ